MERNYKEARSWYHKAAENNSIVGHYNQAILDFHLGEADPFDFQKIFQQPQKKYRKTLAHFAVMPLFFFVHQGLMSYTDMANKIKACVQVVIYPSGKTNAEVFQFSSLNPFVDHALEVLLQEANNHSKDQAILQDIEAARNIIKSIRLKL